MSRAFVKESEETVEDFPERPISPHPNFVTPEGLAQIEATLARLQQEHAAAQAAADRAALARISRDLRYWTARRASAQVIAPPACANVVQFGRVARAPYLPEQIAMSQHFSIMLDHGYQQLVF